jgi:hypothetical protein
MLLAGRLHSSGCLPVPTGTSDASHGNQQGKQQLSNVRRCKVMWITRGCANTLPSCHLVSMHGGRSCCVLAGWYIHDMSRAGVTYGP